MLTRAFLGLITSSLLTACGPRLIQPQDKDGGVLPAKDSLITKRPPPPTDCVLATSISGCCPHVVAATEQEVIDDPCLSAPGLPQSLEECGEQLFCDVECDWSRVPGRLLAREGDRCVFVDECATDTDCVVAEDCTACCCPDAISAALAGQDECLFAPGEERNDCWQPCPGICPPWPTVMNEDGTSYGMVARCEAVFSPTGEIRACVPRQPTWGYLLWQAPGGFAGWGPALEITPSGSTRLWGQTFGQAPHATKDWDVVFRLSNQQVDELFSLLAAVSFEQLPHESGSGGDCYPAFSYQRCLECESESLVYARPADLSPELDAVYAWLNENVAPQAEGIPMPDTFCGF